MQVGNFLSAAEFKAISQPSDREAWRVVLTNWLITFAALWLAYAFPNPVVIVLVLFIVGGRQLGLGVLLHEAGHKSLFKSSRLNETIGQWLCAYPVLSEINAYATTHRQHHLRAGSESDPDLPNYQAYPVEPASFKRKMWRDLSGQTGFRTLIGAFKNQGDLTARAGRPKVHLYRALLVNAALFVLVSLLMAPWVYLLWFVAFLTTFTWCSRIRQVAEHGAVVDLMDKDPRLHTRTTIGSWLERIFLCPNYVNYHCEHHLAPTVPCYRLREFHLLLKARGFYHGFESTISDSYLSVVRRAVA